MGVPLGVEAGDTVPHGSVGHDTDQLTPLAVESLLTMAVKLAVPPASTVAEVAESETLTAGGGGPLLPPPQAQSNRTGIPRAAKIVAAALGVEKWSFMTPPIAEIAPRCVAIRKWGA